MDQLATVKIELGINAQKITSMFMTNNKQLEEVIGESIQAGLDEFCNADNFKDVIKQKTKQELLNMVHNKLFSWDLQDKMDKAIRLSIENKIKEYADKIADKVTSALNESE